MNQWKRYLRLALILLVFSLLGWRFYQSGMYVGLIFLALGLITLLKLWSDMGDSSK